MKFSILIPVYNTEKYLDECIQSVLNQTYQDFEIILVDDGSTDNSGSICDKYKTVFPDKIKVIHKQNQGLISARRVGIDNASGDYCIFVDSDDYIDSDLINTIFCYLQIDNCDLLLYSLRYLRNGKLIERSFNISKGNKKWEGNEKQELYAILATGSVLSSLCLKAIKTDILKQDPTDYSRFYDKNMSEDLFQSLYPMTVAKKIAYIDKVLYNYRLNESSVSHVFDPSKISEKSTLHVYESVLSYLPKWRIDTLEIRERMDAKWLGETMYLFSQYYENAKSSKEKKEIMMADWSQLLPKGVKDSPSKYENRSNRRLYEWLCNNNYTKIRIYFFKKSIYKKYKEFKRKL